MDAWDRHNALHVGCLVEEPRRPIAGPEAFARRRFVAFRCSVAPGGLTESTSRWRTMMIELG